MKRAPSFVLAALIVAGAIVYIGVRGEYPWASPTPMASPIGLASPTTQPCVDDPSNATPCPGTPEPIQHTPLPPLGAIPDSEIERRIPADVSPHDRKIIERVLRATAIDKRSLIRWVYCGGKVFVYETLPPPDRSATAYEVLNDILVPSDRAVEFINPLTCDDFPVPSA
jgi:hypothetical protein